MNIDRYNEIVNLSTEFKQTKIVPFIPNISDEDIDRGYITRFFIQKSNDRDAVIYEIRKKSISKFSNNSFYIITSLDWRIRGTEEEVKKSNSISVQLASKEIPKISLYLPNLLQFHQK